MFDFLGDIVSGAADYVDTGDTADVIGNAVTGAYDIAGEEMMDYAPFIAEMAGSPEVASMMGGAAEGLTGVGWIDKILGRLGNQWEQDPLSMIGAGVGVLGKIDQIRQAQGHKPWLGGRGGGSMEAGGSEAMSRVAALDQMANSVRGAGQGAFNSMANRIPSDTVIPVAAPTVRDPSLFIQQGALSKIKR